MNPRFGLLMALSWLAMTSCDDGKVELRQADCRDFCAKLELCDDRTDLQGCERRCEAEKIRSDEYMTARAECTNKSSCNVWAGEIGLMGEDVCFGDEDCHLNDCTDDVLAEHSLSSAQQAYCEQVVSKMNACDHALTTSALERHCQLLVPRLSQNFLSQLKSCIEVDCGQVKACMLNASDRFNTDISLYPESSASSGEIARRSDAGADAGRGGRRAGQAEAGMVPASAIDDAGVYSVQ